MFYETSFCLKQKSKKKLLKFPRSVHLFIIWYIYVFILYMSIFFIFFIFIPT